MIEHEILLPSKPKIIQEEGNKGVYEIDGLYAGFGHTLGNSLRRVILSSLPGAAITSVKIEGVNHEFSTIPGVKEDVIMILLSLKQIRFKLIGDEPQKATLTVKGIKDITAGDFKAPTQLEILNKDKEVATITDKNTELNIEIIVERGIGYVPREVLKKEKVEIGTLILDAVFTPVRRVNYEIENMRVGDRTDYNKLRFVIETDGSITPREALENSIKILLRQLSAVVDVSEKDLETLMEETRAEQEKIVERKLKKEEEKRAVKMEKMEEQKDEDQESKEDFLKTRIEDLGLSSRTLNSLSKANIRTIGGLVRKKEEDLVQIEGIGKKALNEIRRALGNFGLILK